MSALSEGAGKMKRGASDGEGSFLCEERAFQYWLCGSCLHSYTKNPLLMNYLTKLFLEKKSVVK